ncbi:hypothetical protein ACROYT_G005327 [Oculina patagonica]
MVENVGIVPTAPGTTGRQLHRANAPAVHPKEYYGDNVAVPLLDYINSELDGQFSGLTMRRSQIKVQAGIITADSCAASLKACDPDDFPNLYILLKIAATLPMTSCECRRSISTMRRLNNCMRCTMHMGESRLSSLALMHIKYDMPVDLDEIVNLFQGLHPRMMQLSSLLYE